MHARFAAGRVVITYTVRRAIEKHGYEQSKITTGFWKHKGRPIFFTLVVDDFGVKYVGKEHTRHLISVLKEHHDISEYWEGKKYVGLTFDWDYEKKPGPCAHARVYRPLPHTLQAWKTTESSVSNLPAHSVDV